MSTFVHTISKHYYLKVNTVIVQKVLCSLEIIHFIEIPYLFYFKGIKKVNNKKAVCLALLLSLSLSFFLLPYDLDCELLLHKIIHAEIFVIFAFFLALGIL